MKWKAIIVFPVPDPDLEIRGEGAAPFLIFVVVMVDRAC